MDGADSLIIVFSLVMRYMHRLMLNLVRLGWPENRLLQLCQFTVRSMEAHLEVLPEAAIPFSLSGWPGLWARQNLHALLLPVEQWIRNGVDSGRSTSGARNMLVHETACSGGPEMQV